MGLFDKLFNKKDKDAKKTTSAQTTSSTDKLMTSQLVALYLDENNKLYRDTYIKRLSGIGFTKTDAEKMFEYESNIIRKFNKNYLLHPDFTKMWFFGLIQPFFQQYPKTKEDILKERFFTASELCKIVDEAEWHYWNSHERPLSEEVGNEICEWRLKGKGIEFASEYFKMIENDTGIASESISNLIGEQGNHLCKYKW